MDSAAMKYLVGVDASTQKVKVTFIDPNGEPFANGSASLLDGEESEQSLVGWENAFEKAMEQARQDATERVGWSSADECLAICVSGQMHAETLRLDDGTYCEKARLWRDGRNAEEGRELSKLFGLNNPQRLTNSRFLWTVRNRPVLARRCTGLTTTAGYLATKLDRNAWSLGLGEARGMFPIDPLTLGYDSALAAKFDSLTRDAGIRPILDLLPTPVKVGTIIGTIDEAGSVLSGLPLGTPIISPEGDQPTTLAGTHVWRERILSFSVGTSICGNLLSSLPFLGIHPGVEPFMAADGTPFYMCHGQNGTSWLNVVIDLFSDLIGDCDPFEVLMPLAADAPVDAFGIDMIPFAEPEHGLGFGSEGRSAIFNLRAKKAGEKHISIAGCLVRQALASSMFTILYSINAMREQDIDADEIVASGGVFKGCTWPGQLIADVFNLPVTTTAEAGITSQYGAALMALYGYRLQSNAELGWGDFLDEMRPNDRSRYVPIPDNVQVYSKSFDRFVPLAEKVEPELIEIIPAL